MAHIPSELPIHMRYMLPTLEMRNVLVNRRRSFRVIKDKMVGLAIHDLQGLRVCKASFGVCTAGVIVLAILFVILAII